MTSDCSVDFSVLSAWADALLPAVAEAGKAILRVRAQGFNVAAKADETPVTAADHAAEAVVLAALERLAPAFPIVAEERAAAGKIPLCAGYFWLVDALDGTKEFIKGGNDFTVNVAFVADHLPVLGLVHAPARDETYLGIVGAHSRAELLIAGKARAISARPRGQRVVVVGSKSHEVEDKMEAFLARYDVGERVVVGSSLKFCLVAQGKADLYPRFSPTSEWDTAAGHAVLRAAGGRVHDFEGHDLRYGKAKFLNGPFLAEGP